MKKLNLIRTIKLLKSYANRVSLFIDPTTEGVDYAHSMGADSIELYTENYAKTFKKIDSSLLIEILSPFSLIQIFSFAHFE